MRTVTVVALALLCACAETIDPRTTGARQLVAVAGLRCEGGQPFAFSPDGRWLVFSRREHIEGSHQARDHLALLSLPEGRVIWPGRQGEPDGFSALSGGPSPEQACWSDDGTVYFHRSAPAKPHESRHTGRVAAYASRAGNESHAAGGWQIQLDEPGSLLPASRPDGCERNRDNQWRFVYPEGAKISPERRILPTHPEGRDSIVLTLPDGRLLARHETQAATSDQIVLAAYAWAPNGRRLAYLISESAGSFGRPGRAWLRDLERQAPAPLGTGLYSLQWRDERTLFACARIGGQREISIIRWRFPNPDIGMSAAAVHPD